MNTPVRVHRVEWYPVLELEYIAEIDPTLKNDLNLNKQIVDDYEKAFQEFKAKEWCLFKEIENVTGKDYY